MFGAVNFSNRFGARRLSPRLRIRDVCTRICAVRRPHPIPRRPRRVHTPSPAVYAMRCHCGIFVVRKGWKFCLVIGKRADICAVERRFPLQRIRVSLTGKALIYASVGPADNGAATKAFNSMAGQYASLKRGWFCYRAISSANGAGFIILRYPSPLCYAPAATLFGLCRTIFKRAEFNDGVRVRGNAPKTGQNQAKIIKNSPFSVIF